MDAVVTTNALFDTGGADLMRHLAGARLLLVAPHPDDESLALGGLIQHAVRQQANVTILQVTDGDNNPWPQRVLERRLRIGPVDRRRWGERRADEMLEAMQRLGLDAASRHRLGWPDLGVTMRLQTRGTESIDAMADILRDTAPDLVVLPALSDTHPDHASCHVMIRLAMQRVARPFHCLTYHVHGHRHEVGPAIELPLDAAMLDGKRHAILAHHTQVALARHRLLARAGAIETLHALPSPAPGDVPLPRIVALPWQPSRAWRPWLQLTLAHPGGVHVWSWREAPLTMHARQACLVLPEAVRHGPAYAKLEMRCKSPWIFDRWGWCDLSRIGADRPANH